MDRDKLQYSAWETFEKKSGIYQTRKKKSALIIKSVEDSEDFLKVATSLHNDASFAVVQFGGSGKVHQAAICVDTKTILLDAANYSLPSVLTFLLSVYYVIDLNYPKKYTQYAGILAKWVLGHDTVVSSWAKRHHA